MTLQILAVDDSRTMRDMVRLTLTGAGFGTHLAEDGVHGLEVLETIAPPDAIITVACSRSARRRRSRRRSSDAADFTAPLGSPGIESMSPFRSLFGSAGRSRA